MLHLKADSEANHRRFLTRAIAKEEVWGIQGPSGFLACESSSEEHGVLPFWSDRAYAERSVPLFDGGEAASIGLFNFLFRWLPGLEGDQLLVGTNWTQDLAGKEIEPLELQDALLDAMSEQS